MQVTRVDEAAVAMGSDSFRALPEGAPGGEAAEEHGGETVALAEGERLVSRADADVDAVSTMVIGGCASCNP